MMGGKERSGARRRAPFLAAAILLVLFVPAAEAADEAPAAASEAAPATAVEAAPSDAASLAEPAARVTLFPTALRGEVAGELEEDAAVYSSALRSSLKRRLGEAGYAVAEDGEPLAGGRPEPWEAASRAREAGASFAAVLELSLAAGRLSYRVAVYDSEDGSLCAGDGFSAFAGLAAVSLLDTAAARVVEKLSSYDSRRPGIARRLVGYRLVVDCPLEGAAVTVEAPGAPSGIRAGRISGGRLELPYYPFVQGSTIAISVSAEGRRTLRTKATLGPEPPPPIALSPPPPKYDLLLGTGTGRLMGLGGELRFFPGSEWIFGFAEARIYAGSDFQTGSAPLMHTDFWEGLGSYLFFPPSSRFRMGWAAGFGLLVCTLTAKDAASRSYCDLALLPLEIFGEYRLKGNLGAWMSLRFAYALGTELLPQGWIGNGPPALSLGALWRKR